MRIADISKGAALLFTGAAFASCAGGPAGSSLASPNAAASTAAASAYPNPDRSRRLLHRHMSRKELLKLQAEGKIAASIPAKVLAWQLAHRTAGRSERLIKRSTAVPALWAADTNNDYLVGEKAGLTATVADINTRKDGCDDPITVKVDSSQNIWTNCEYGVDFSEQGVGAAEYSSAGTLVNTYNSGCNSTEFPYDCEIYFGYGFDQAENSSYVFGFDDFIEGYFCVSASSCPFYDGGAFAYWPNGSPSGEPTLIVPSSIEGAPDTIDDGYYMDVDASNNIYFDFYGCQNQSPYSCGYGLGEIENATTSPAMLEILPPGALEFPGGVVVSGGGTTLNVTDQDARTICQLAMPASSGEVCSRTLGPTKADFMGLGNPVSGDFNLTQTKLAEGDAYGWLDTSVDLSSNIWKDKQNPGLLEPEGAAYTPSDR